MPRPSRSPIELTTDRDGALLYRVTHAPDALPPVRSGYLADGWDAARRAAAAACWGEPRRFRFQPDDADAVDLALLDDDASCWAAAVDAGWDLRTPYGLSLCLRLLGLVALLAHSAALRGLCPLPRAGGRLDPALLRAAATVPLLPGGHLDERRVCAHLARVGPAPSLPAIVHSGASS